MSAVPRCGSACRSRRRATVTRNRRAAARPRHRRAVHVLPDPRPDGPRLDLAAKADAADGTRARPRQAARGTMIVVVPANSPGRRGFRLNLLLGEQKV